MSQWTHIRGGLELTSTPYEQKKFTLEKPNESDFESEEDYNDAYWKWREKYNKTLYFPYPEEQFKLSMPITGTSYGKKKKNGKREEFHTLEFRAYVYSLPRARKYIEEAFKLLPNNEMGLGVRHSIDQDIHDSTSSSSGFWLPAEYKAYRDTLTRMYYSKDSWHSYDYNDLKKYMHINKDCSVEHINHILVGIRDDVRYCSGQQMQEGLEKFFTYLEEHDISVDEGYLEWQDEYEPDKIWAWRNSGLAFEVEHQFLILDKKTNRIIHSKIYKRKKTPDGKRDFDAKGYDIIEEDYPEKDFDEEF